MLGARYAEGRSRATRQRGKDQATVFFNTSPPISTWLRRNTVDNTKPVTDEMPDATG
jgi:hypothetical protein